MAKAAAAVAPSRTNVRREIDLDSSVIARDPVGAGTRNWTTGRAGRNSGARCAWCDAQCAPANRPDAWLADDRGCLTTPTWRVRDEPMRIAQCALRNAHL